MKYGDMEGLIDEIEELNDKLRDLVLAARGVMKEVAMVSDFDKLREALKPFEDIQ